jgi:hypothetical protein
MIEVKIIKKRKGKKTPREEIVIIKQRLKIAKEISEERKLKKIILSVQEMYSKTWTLKIRKKNWRK